MSKKHVTKFRGDEDTPEEKIDGEQAKTPMEEDFGFGDYNRLDPPLNNNFGFMKKSMSMNDINQMREDLAINEVAHGSSRYNPHRRPTNNQLQESSKAKFGSMAEAINQPTNNQLQESSKAKFGSMAEAINRSARFHSTRPQIFRPQGFTGSRAKLTRPQSPNLRSKARSRPVHVITQQEKEVLELEEIKKHKIKALPLPKSILYGPIHLPEVYRKPVTKPEPFNLTKIPNKILKKDEIKSSEPVFKARPVPKHIFEKPHVPVRSILPKTKTPKFHNKKANSQSVNKNKPEPHQKPGETRNWLTRPEPFSFEHADFERKLRKEEWIKRRIEVEKQRASSFKATPLPAGIRKRKLSPKTKEESTSTASSSTSDHKENYFKFEAPPTVVLHEEPLQPVLPKVQIVKPMQFEPSTCGQV